MLEGVALGCLLSSYLLVAVGFGAAARSVDDSRPLLFLAVFLAYRSLVSCWGPSLFLVQGWGCIVARPKGGNLLENSVHLGIRVDGETNEALQRIADALGMSKSALARQALEGYVKEIAARKRKRT